MIRMGLVQMNRRFKGKLLLALLAALTGAMAGQAEAENVPKADHGVPDGYVIGAGDVLQIIVWKEQDATVPTVVVRADGKVSLPFAKEVGMAGLTPSQAEEAISARLKGFINEPDVTVIVREVNSKKIYVVGAVKREGTIALKYPMTMLQALSEAGGLTDYAKRKKIYILRTENGKQSRIFFNYDAVIKGQQMDQNVHVMPDDTIVVPN
jgi:polysaccharide export outer membrane protein